MFKLGSFEEELVSSMERGLLSNQAENKFSVDKLTKVADYLSAAAELLDDTGYVAEANMVTKVLAKLAGVEEDENDAKHHVEADPWKEMPEEIIIEPLEQDLFVAPKMRPEGSIPLVVDEDGNISEDPEAKFFGDDEYLSFQSIASKLSKQLHKKKA